MDQIVLDKIEFKPEPAGMMSLAGVKEGSGLEDEFIDLAREACGVARPKVLFGVAYVEEKGEDYVVVEGVRFSSRVLRVNMEHAEKVFPFAGTCGMELEEWSGNITDALHKSWIRLIGGMALAAALNAFQEYLKSKIHPGKTVMMNPGSIKEWPIEEQIPLWRLLGDVERAIGVVKHESQLMTPGMSASGLRFPAEHSFESCMLCPREDCPMRRAKYNKALGEEKYGA